MKLHLKMFKCAFKKGCEFYFSLFFNSLYDVSQDPAIILIKNCRCEIRETESNFQIRLIELKKVIV